MRLQNIFNAAIVTLLLLSPISCKALVGGNPTVEPILTATVKILESPMAIENQNWVIFTNRQAEEMNLASWLVESDNFWTPSADDILKLEERLPDYLQQNSYLFYRQPPVWQRLEEYQRQYIGLERDGKKIVYGNYFCDSGRTDWRHEFVVVMDGGDCYFQIEYDVESGFFIMLMVNGEA